MKIFLRLMFRLCYSSHSNLGINNMGKFSIFSKIGLVVIFLIWVIIPKVFFIKAVFTGIDVGRRSYVDIVVLVSLALWYYLFRLISRRKGLFVVTKQGKKIVDGDALVFSFFVSTAIYAVYLWITGGF